MTQPDPFQRQALHSMALMRMLKQYLSTWGREVANCLSKNKEEMCVLCFGEATNEEHEDQTREQKVIQISLSLMQGTH